MRLRWLVLSPLLLAFIGTAITARERDLLYEETVTFKIKSKRGRYTLSSETTIIQKYLSERSLATEEWLFTSRQTAPISKFKVEHNGKTKRDLVREQPMPSESGVFLDDKLIVVTVPGDLKVGDALSVKYKQSYIDIAYFPLLEVPNVNTLKKYWLIFEHPKEIRIEPEVYFPHGAVPYRVARPSDKETRVLLDAMPYAEPLPYFAFNEQLAFILIMVKSDTGAVTPTSPESYLRWYSQQVPLAANLDSASAARIDSSLHEAEDTLLFADINSYIRDRIRSIANVTELHGIIPHSPSEVMRLEYGDCKDRSYLATAIAHHFDRRLWMATVSTSIQPEFAGIHYGLWDHVICAYEADSGYRFFDPTAEYFPFGELPSFLMDRRCLILREDSPAVVTTVVTDSVPLLEYDITGSLDSISGMNARITLRKGLAAMARVYRDENDESSFSVLFASILSSHLSQVGISNVDWEDDSGGVVRLSATADLSYYAVVLPDRVYFPPSPFAFPSNDILTRATDSLALHFGSMEHLRFTLSLAGPGLTTEPGSIHLGQRDNALFTAAIEQAAPDSISLQAESCRYPSIFTDDARQRFMDFCEAYFAAKKEMFSIEVNQP